MEKKEYERYLEDIKRRNAAEKEQQRERPYYPSDMRVGMPLGCFFIPLAIALILIYILIRINSHP